MNSSQPKLGDFFNQIIHNNPPSTLILLALAMAVWLIGGKLLIRSHYRKLGRSRPLFGFPFATFNRREWRNLALLALVSAILATAGLLQQPNVRHVEHRAHSGSSRLVPIDSDKIFKTAHYPKIRFEAHGPVLRYDAVPGV